MEMATTALRLSWDRGKQACSGKLRGHYKDRLPGLKQELLGEAGIVSCP